MTVDASSLKSDLSSVASEFAGFVDRIKNGASQTEDVKKKAADAAKEVASSVQSMFSSIQGGQSPLTSMVGEATKLISSLGGVGSTAGAMGAYLKGTVTPLNLAMKAVALLTEAYVEGRKEATAYASATVMTGNYAGLTTDQLRSKAIDIAGTQGTEAKSAEAITAVINTGRISGDVVSEVAGATADMNRVLGTSINEAVSNFVKLSEEPSKASAKLNETYHYLDVSTYARIVALEKQGKSEEAAALAQKEFANAMKQRAGDVVNNLGSLERGWLAVTNVAKRAWDAMLNVGRPETFEMKVKKIDDELALYADPSPTPGGAIFDSPKAKAVRQKKREELLEKKDNLVRDDLLNRRSAHVQSEQAHANELAIAKLAEKKDKPEGSGRASGINRAQDDGVRLRLEAVREEYNAQARETAEGLKKIESLRRQGLLNDYDFIRQRRDQRLKDLQNQQNEVESELRILGPKKGSSEEKQKLAFRSKQIEQQRSFVNDEADRSFAEQDATSQNAVLKTAQDATEKIRERTRAMEEQNAVYGLSAEEVQKLNIAQLNQQINDLEATNNVIPGYVEALRERLNALQQATQKSEGLKAAEEEKKKGKKKEDEEKEEQEKKTKKMADDIGGVFKDGFVNLLEGGGRDAIDKMGKALQKKLTQSLAEAFYDATLKDAVAGFSKWLTGALKGSGSAGGAPGSGGGGGLLGGLGDMVKGLFGGISNMFSGIWDFASSGISSLFSGGSSLFSGLLSIFSAKGNVFASSGLHAYANSVVGKPTFFPFAHGIGLMGEAGPEAIMPLRRGSDGRLGVSAPVGGSGGGSLHYAPTNVFNIDSRSDRGAVLADLDRALQVNNQGQMEQLKRLRVVPQ